MRRLHPSEENRSGKYAPVLVLTENMSPVASRNETSTYTPSLAASHVFSRTDKVFSSPQTTDMVPYSLTDNVTEKKFLSNENGIFTSPVLQNTSDVLSVLDSSSSHPLLDESENVNVSSTTLTSDLNTHSSYRTSPETASSTIYTTIISNGTNIDSVEDVSISDVTDDDSLSTTPYVDMRSDSTIYPWLNGSKLDYVTSDISNMSTTDTFDAYSVQDSTPNVTSFTTNDFPTTYTRLENATDFSIMESDVSNLHSEQDGKYGTDSPWDTFSSNSSMAFTADSTQTYASTLLTEIFSTLVNFDMDERNYTSVRTSPIDRSSSSFSSSSPSKYGYVEEVQRKAYNIFLPIFICLGIVANVICIIVLVKPKMRLVHVNKYFLALAISDLMVCLMNIPIAVMTNGCSLSSYVDAVYFGYLGWSMIEMWQTLSFYTILFLSCDRFLAVWYYQHFKRQKTEAVTRKRLAITVIADILVHLVFFINVDIRCKDGSEIHKCDSTKYIIEDTYRMNDHQVWHKLYLVFHELVVRWLPGILLLIFNVGLVAAIVMGRLNNPASSHRSKKRTEFRLTITLIAITSSFIICTFPNTVYSVGFAANIEGECYGEHEVFRAVSNNLQLLEHVIHIVFLVMLNPSFRGELLSLLTCRPSPETHSDANQSSRDLNMHQVNRRSGHSPFPNKSPSHSPYPSKRLSGGSQASNSVFALAPPTQHF